MLFNSPIFLFAFLPIFLAVYFLVARVSHAGAMLWALLASLVFYAWDDPIRLAPLIVTSIAFNFVIGRVIARTHAFSALAFGVTVNLLTLGYFKYATFLLGTAASIFGLPELGPVATLPIGISFYTFTQIAFLVDTYRRIASEYEPLKYGLFVSYFPHLIAGPILHHKEIMPQFDRPETYRPQLGMITLGLGWLSMGLFKKVMLADNVAAFVDAPFKAASVGKAVSFSEAWTGALSYTLQIYFDFSGYSDMAIGLALMMGITFPLNFNSPYKASSLIEFWRRWHMTLSRFLRDYLYIPLGGNRRGPYRRYLNLLITMILGGLWHGASWNFAVWGAIHGLGLAINHLWQDVAGRLGITMPRLFGWVLTSVIVVVAWVPFRADTMPAAILIWHSMIDVASATSGPKMSFDAISWIVCLSAIALLAPNTQQILRHPWLSRPPTWPNMLPDFCWAAAFGCLFGISVVSTFAKPSYFLYFRF